MIEIICLFGSLAFAGLGTDSNDEVRLETHFPSLPELLSTCEGTEACFRYRRAKHETSLQVPDIREGVVRVLVGKSCVYVEETYLDVPSAPGEIVVPRRVTTYYEPPTGQYVRLLEREGGALLAAIDYMKGLPSIVFYACGVLGLGVEATHLTREDSSRPGAASFTRPDGTGFFLELDADDRSRVSSIFRHKGLPHGGAFTVFRGRGGLARDGGCDVIVETQLDQDDVPMDTTLWNAVTLVDAPADRVRLDEVVVPAVTDVIDYRERSEPSKASTSLDRPMRLEDLLSRCARNPATAPAVEVASPDEAASPAPLAGWKVASAGLGGLLALLWILGRVKRSSACAPTADSFEMAQKGVRP